MKLKYFVLFVASILLLDGSLSIAAPRQFAAQPRLDSYDTPDGYQTCQAVSQAVVTIYAGTEIGSGSIINPNGLILTNHHVVKEIVQSAGSKKIFVKLANGNRYTGQLIKTDRPNDLALIQIKAPEQLPTVRLASSNRFETGQRVCAIGSPFGRSGVLSEGTLNLIKTNGDLQSNVLLNPGNSGGPLLNSRGEMIGVNKAILQSPSGKNMGISFATSILVAKNFIEQNRPGSISSSIAQTVPAASGRSVNVPLPKADPLTRSNSQSQVVTDPNLVIEPSYLAATPTANPEMVNTDPNLVIEPSYLTSPQPASPPRTATLTPASSTQLGVMLNVGSLTVQQVQFGSPAATAGIRPGDRLVAINGDQLRRFEELQALLKSQPNSVVLTVLRRQQLATVKVNF